nr:MAG TPA: hypothetical protein [Bacteriophage sp.]
MPLLHLLSKTTALHSHSSQFLLVRTAHFGKFEYYS